MGQRTLNIAFTASGATEFKVGYRVKGSSDPYLYLFPNPTSLPISIPGVDEKQYEVEVTAICEQQVLADPVIVYSPAIDPEPDQFSFLDQVNKELNTQVVSNPITVSGINVGIPISISGGEYQVNQNEWTNAQGTVHAGDVVSARILSSSQYNTQLDAVLNMGGVVDTFSVTTKVAPQIQVSWSHTVASTPAANASLDISSGGTSIISQSSNGSGQFNQPAATQIRVLMSSNTSDPWPPESKASLVVKKNGQEIFNQTVSAQVATLFDFSFTLEENSTYEIAGTTDAHYIPVPGLWIGDKSTSACELQWTSEDIGAVMVDFFDDTTLDAIAYITGVADPTDFAYKNQNFVPLDATANNAWMLASDPIDQASRLKWRFAFNLSKLVTVYPGIDVFNMEIRGRSSLAGSVSGSRSLKLATEGDLQMQGTEGSYIPTHPSTSTGVQNFTATVQGGANGTFNTTLPTILQLRYTVTTKRLEHSTDGGNTWLY